MYIIKRPPTNPFQYGLDHFTRKQSEMIGLLLEKVHDSDLDIFKFFDFYGVFVFQRDHQVANVTESMSEEEIDSWLYELVENDSKIKEIKQRFHKKYCLDRRPREQFEEGPEDEYDRLMKMEGVSEALLAIYEARFFKK